MEMILVSFEIGEERLTYPLCGDNGYQCARLGLRYSPLDKLVSQNILLTTSRYVFI